MELETNVFLLRELPASFLDLIQEHCLRNASNLQPARGNRHAPGVFSPLCSVTVQSNSISIQTSDTNSLHKTRLDVSGAFEELILTSDEDTKNGPLALIVPGTERGTCAVHRCAVAIHPFLTCHASAVDSHPVTSLSTSRDDICGRVQSMLRIAEDRALHGIDPIPAELRGALEFLCSQKVQGLYFVPPSTVSHVAACRAGVDDPQTSRRIAFALLRTVSGRLMAQAKLENAQRHRLMMHIAALDPTSQTMRMKKSETPNTGAEQQEAERIPTAPNHGKRVSSTLLARDEGPRTGVAVENRKNEKRAKRNTEPRTRDGRWPEEEQMFSSSSVFLQAMERLHQTRVPDSEETSKTVDHCERVDKGALTETCEVGLNLVSTSPGPTTYETPSHSYPTLTQWCRENLDCTLPPQDYLIRGYAASQLALEAVEDLLSFQSSLKKSSVPDPTGGCTSGETKAPVKTHSTKMGTLQVHPSVPFPLRPSCVRSILDDPNFTPLCPHPFPAPNSHESSPNHWRSKLLEAGVYQRLLVRHSEHYSLYECQARDVQRHGELVERIAQTIDITASQNTELRLEFHAWLQSIHPFWESLSKRLENLETLVRMERDVLLSHQNLVHSAGAMLGL